MRDSADELDRRLRQAVTGTTLASTLRDKVREAQAWTWRQKIIEGVFGVGIGVPVIVVGLPVAIGWSLSTTLGPTKSLALLSATWTVTAGGFAWTLGSRLHCSKQLAVASVLPVADKEIARSSWSAAGALALTVLYFNLWFVGCLVVIADLGWWWGLIAFAATTGQCAVCMALGTMFYLYLPAMCLCVITIGGSVATLAYVAGHLIEANWPSAAARYVFWMTPAGWLNAPLAIGFEPGDRRTWWGLLPAVFISTAGLQAYRRLLGTYRIYELVPGRDGQALAVTSFGDPLQIGFLGRLWCWMTGSLAELTLDDVELHSDESAKHRIRSREFLSLPSGARRTLVERGQRFWLSPRENAICDYLTNDDGTWSLIWLIVAGLAGLLMLGSAVLEKVASHHFWLSPQVPAVVLVVFVSGFGVLSIFIGPWVGLTTSGAARAAPPRFGLWPIGFDEITRMIVKIVAARMLLLLPLYVASFGLIVVEFRPSPAPGLDRQAQLMLIAAPLVAFVVALAGQGYLIGWKFNNAATFGRLSSRNIWWFVAVWAGSPIGVFVAWQSMSMLFAYVLSTIPFAAASGLWGALPVVLLAGLFGGSFAVWLVARESYRRSVADLAVTRAKSFQLSTRTVDQGISVAHRRRALRRRYGWLWWLRKPGLRQTTALRNGGQGGSRGV